jgi:hypothetical protein
MSSIKRPTYLVELADGTQHTAEVLHGDQLRAELEAPKHHLPVDSRVAPLHSTTLWCWASLVRQGLVTDDFQTFRASVVGLQPAAKVAEDPTPEGQPTVSG